MSAPDPARTTMGAPGAPGAVNAHTHLYSGLAPFGLPAPDPLPRSFLDILRRVWWRLDRALDHDALRAAARFYAGSALLSGTTTLIDHHESPHCIEGSLDALADACQSVGVRAVLCYGATERNGGLAEARRGLAECRRLLATNARPLVRAMVGLHASFTLGDEAIREAGALCRELGAVTHVHVAEDRIDIDDARARGYEGPLQRLLALGALPPGSILAHGVHLSEAEVRLASARGLWLVQCPRSNRHNGVGYPSALRHADRVALGTDGFPADMAEEAEALSRAGREDAGAAERRLEAGLRLAAERFGAVDPADEGPGADRVLFEPAGPGGARRVRSALIAGREVVRAGRLTLGDMDAIRAEAVEAAARVFRRMRSLEDPR